MHYGTGPVTLRAVALRHHERKYPGMQCVSLGVDWNKGVVRQ